MTNKQMKKNCFPTSLNCIGLLSIVCVGAYIAFICHVVYLKVYVTPITWFPPFLHEWSGALRANN